MRLAFDWVREPLDARDERAVQALGPADADALKLDEAALAVGDEAVDVDVASSRAGIPGSAR